MDSNNKPRISFYRDKENGNYTFALQYAYKNLDGSWNITTVDEDTSGGDVKNVLGYYNDICLDSNGYPHIVYSWIYCWYYPQTKCKYAYYNGSSWTKMFVDERTDTYVPVILQYV
ncbi:MAG: hypothetical protein ACUVWP_01075 [bacterium]